MANTGIVGSNPANQATGQDVHTRSKFPFGYKFADTHRFGEYHPFFVMEGVEGDKINLHCAHDVRSYTLGAPLLQDIQLKKDYFAVPREAILPLNWDKFYTIPTIGDDVPDDVGTTVVGFWSKVGSAWSSMMSYLIGISHPTDVNFFTGLFRTLIFGEFFYSEGSLLSSLGAHGGVHFNCVTSGLTPTDWSLGGAIRRYTYDEFFDACLNRFRSDVHSFTLRLYNDDGSTPSYRVYTALNPNVLWLNTGSGNRVHTDIDFRTALQIMRDHPFSIEALFVDDGTQFTYSAVSDLVDVFVNGLSTSGDSRLWDVRNPISSLESEDKLDLARVLAYQIVCNHFYSNDHVDYVYSAQLYRQLIGFYISYVNLLVDDSLVSTFDYNGISYQYDFLSAFYFGVVVGAVDSDILIDTSVDSSPIWSYFCQIFSYKRSLRFLDYFTGARSQPLAVAQSDINVNVDGTSGTGYSVSAINITKGIQAQRLANAVNRFGRKFEDYIAGMSGKRPAPDYHNPFYLSHTSDVIYGQESEYTGNMDNADPQNVTTTLRSAGGKYAFEIECDRPSILIGIAYYDIERFYGRTTERQFFHVNRYDMFNKYMQFIGDQPIYRAELGALDYRHYPVDGNFAYTNRHMEYKQRYNQVSGAFNVPSTDINKWLFRSDDANLNSYTLHISPSFIRSWNSELDQYYLSLTGMSLGTYFHFIVKNINSCEANRPMAYAPSIL